MWSLGVNQTIIRDEKMGYACTFPNKLKRNKASKGKRYVREATGRENLWFYKFG